MTRAYIDIFRDYEPPGAARRYRSGKLASITLHDVGLLRYCSESAPIYGVICGDNDKVSDLQIAGVVRGEYWRCSLITFCNNVVKDLLSVELWKTNVICRLSMNYRVLTSKILGVICFRQTQNLNCVLLHKIFATMFLIIIVANVMSMFHFFCREILKAKFRHRQLHKI